MKKKPQLSVIEDLQNNPNYVILNNPLSALKFVRKLGLKTEQTLTEVYTPKLFYEIISRLKPEHLEGVGKQQTILLTINIKDFLKEVDTSKSRNLYSHILDCVDRLQTTQVKWTENAIEKSATIISYYEHHAETNEIDVQVHSELAKKVLELTHFEHFSFLKNYLYKLNNAQAIKLFPYFISWHNKGMVQISLKQFREKFGYDTEGYSRFANIKLKILDPAIAEINEKTNLIVHYKLLGENLTSLRPRVAGLQFFIKEKAKQKQLPQQVAIEYTPVEVVETTAIQPKPTTVKAHKPTVSQAENPYLADILRIFHVFEPDSSPESINGFLMAFDNKKAILEACLYAEQEQIKGRLINNFRGYLVAGIPKGLGSGILEQRVKDQAKAQQVEQKKTTQADKATELENLLKEADILRGGYRTAMDMLLQNTPTNDKENVAAILRKKRVNYASRTLEEFESIMFIADYIDTFITTYPERFAAVQNTYQKAFDGLAVKIKELAPAKAKNLFHY
jgi:plasmid replication initiation protein